MNETKIAASLDDTEALRKLILDNPDLPLIIFCGEESYAGEYSYNIAEINKISVEEMTYHGEYYVKKEDYQDILFEKLENAYETEEQLSHAVSNLMNDTEFLRAIVIYVG